MNRLLSIMSRIMNAYLKLDPDSTKRLHALQHKVVSIELLPFHYIFYCQFTDDGVNLSEQEIKSDTQIKGTPLQMLSLINDKKDRQQFFADDVRIEGNVELGQKVIALLDEMSIDYQDLLAQWLPDIPAYHLSSFAGKTLHFIKNQQQRWRENVSEYLHEETRWFPNHDALKDFYHDIDQLRMDTDRLQAKIEQLKNQLISEDLE